MVRTSTALVAVRGEPASSQVAVRTKTYVAPRLRTPGRISRFSSVPPVEATASVSRRSSSDGVRPAGVSR